MGIAAFVPFEKKSTGKYQNTIPKGPNKLQKVKKNNTLQKALKYRKFILSVLPPSKLTQNKYKIMKMCVTQLREGVKKIRF